MCPWQESLIQAGEKIELMPVTFDEMIQLVLEDKIRQEGLNTLILRALVDPRKMEELKKLF